MKTSASCFEAWFIVAMLIVALFVANPVSALDGVTTVRVASGLNRPIFVTAPEGDYRRLFIMEQRGVIKILDLLTGQVYADEFLDINSLVTGPDTAFDERGLLGMAFHPDYLENGYFFVHYSGPNGGDTVVARFSVDPTDPNLADEDSELVLLEVEQPYTNHNGGSIAFSPVDGFLYIGLGDGGSANDPEGRAQDGGELLGKMLRIDVNDFDSDTYSIPDDNPFVDDVDVLDEIWAIGMRNPYRWSFDRSTGDMYIGDVGQGAEEEIDFQPAGSSGGENYGWRCQEGFDCTGLTGCSCPSVALTDPITSYPHSLGRCSVTGGFVYRGTAIPEIDGLYFYADWCSADIYALSYDGSTLSDEEDVTTDLAPGGGLDIAGIAGFGEDAFGEMYILDRGTTTTGEVFKIVPEDIASVDCNGNFIVDSEEIAVGLAEDLDEDGVIDLCEVVALLTPSDGAEADEFGRSVAIDGNVAVVGAPADDDLGTGSGSAYVYRFDGELWTEETKLLASDGSAGAAFGFSVAIADGVIAVGARQDDGPGSNAGAAYLFLFDEFTGEWSEAQKLTASDAADSADFGYSVALDAGLLVVGARLEDGGGSNAGAAYVFREDGGDWSEEQKLLASDAAAFDEYGYSVDVDGAQIIVGSRHDDDDGSNAGSAYIYRFVVDAWFEEQKLTASDAAMGAEFGAAVSISGDSAMVGAFLEDADGINSGGLYGYHYDAGTGQWGDEQAFVSAASVAGDQLGISVSQRGRMLVAGANMSDARGVSSGQAHLFYMDGTGTWGDSALEFILNISAGDELGASVGATSGAFIAGAPFGAASGTEAGIAYVVFTLDCNLNGVRDARDIADGTSADCNTNAIPDECELEILEQPQSQQVAEGQTASFTVVVDTGAGASYQWRKDGIDIGGATSAVFELATVTADDAGTYSVVISDGCLSNTSAGAELTIVEESGFKRGDFDGDGVTAALSDAIEMLNWAFLNGEDPPCMDAADVDDSGNVAALVDALRLLNWAFLGGLAPPAPGPEDCGADPTADDVGCDTPTAACR